MLESPVPQVLLGECRVISSTICATVLQWKDAKMECFVRFPGFVGPSSHFLLVENIAFNYSPFLLHSSLRAFVFKGKLEINGM